MYVDCAKELLPATKDFTFKEYNTTQEKVDEDVKTIKNWLHMQPHLPKIEDTDMIERFLMVLNKNSVERTKKQMEMLYSLRSAMPEIYHNRDPLLPEIQNTMNTMVHIPMPKLTDKNERIYVFKFLDTNPDNYDCWNHAKLLVMMSDLRLKFDYCSGDRTLLDLEGASLFHIKKITPTFIKKLTVLVTEAYKVRILGLHFVNVPSYAEPLINLIKRILKPKLRERVHLHNNTDSLHKIIPKEVLPSDYGGDEISIRELNEKWRQCLISHKDWFAEDEKLKGDLSKRPENMNTDELFGSMHGSFRKLDVD